MRTHSRTHARRYAAVIVSLLALAGFLAAIVMPATGAPGDELLPDLKAEPIGDADSSASTYTVDGQTSLLLRFTSYIRNEGAGPLEITGVNASDRKISGTGIHQVITHEPLTVGAPGEKTEVPLPAGAELKYEETDGHQHWHFQKAARYSLWNDGKTEETGVSSKVGFCFLDIERGDEHWQAGDAGFPVPEGFGVGEKTFYHDELTHPAYPCLNETPEPLVTQSVDMGISRGWRDVYGRELPFQYVDVSDTKPGYYWLRSQVDPENLIHESDDTNPAVFAGSRSTVPGYVAKPVNAGQISGVKESTSKITLAQDKFSNPADSPLGAVLYKIIEQPDHGTVTPLTGAPDADGWFSSQQVRYTKDGTYNGPDTFKFTTKQAGPAGQFPLHPTSASVTMQVGSGNGATSVGINFAPTQLMTSEGAQLGATVAPSGDVTWKVEDIVGGNATVGTIDSSGFYKAPNTVPVDGKVRITATSDDGAFDAVEITIVPRPVVTPPKPDLPDPPVVTPPVVTPPSVPSTPTKPVAALSKPTIARMGRHLVVKYMPGKTGKLSVSVSRKGKRIASCKVAAVKGRGATCKFTLRKSKIRKLTGSLTVYGKLAVKGKTVATRRTKVSLKVTASSARFGPLCILVPVK